MRSAIVLGNGLLSWGITFIWLMWLAWFMLYSLALFYFETTLGLVSGITRTNIGQYNLATVNELWLRQVVPNGLGQPCFSGHPVVCQLADVTANFGSLNGFVIILAGAALVPTFVTLLLSRRFTRPRSHS